MKSCNCLLTWTEHIFVAILCNFFETHTRFTAMGRGWVGAWTRTCSSSSATGYTTLVPVSPSCPASINWIRNNYYLATGRVCVVFAAVLSLRSSDLWVGYHNKPLLKISFCHFLEGLVIFITQNAGGLSYYSWKEYAWYSSRRIVSRSNLVCLTSISCDLRIYYPPQVEKATTDMNCIFDHLEI